MNILYEDGSCFVEFLFFILNLSEAMILIILIYKYLDFSWLKLGILLVNRAGILHKQKHELTINNSDLLPDCERRRINFFSSVCVYVCIFIWHIIEF